MTPPSTDSPTAPSLDASLYDDAPPNWRDELVIPDVSDLVTEDDTPVDNLLQEKLQRFLVQCLYSSLKCDTPFLAAADVGLFYAIAQSPLVPDVMLSLGVSMPQDWREKRKRSYFIAPRCRHRNCLQQERRRAGGQVGEICPSGGGLLRGI